MIKKRMALLLCLAILAGLWGCDQFGKGAEGTAEDSGSKTAKLELALFQGGYGEDYWKSVIEAFQMIHPEVEITYQIHPQIGEMIKPRVLSGDAPDFLYHNDNKEDGLVQTMIRNHALTDLTDVFEGRAYDREETLRDIIAIPNLLESEKFSPYQDGKVYLAPFNYSPVGLVYDRSLFAENGWQVPQTWQQFFALGEEAAAQGRTLFVYPGVYHGYLEGIFFPAVANAVGLEGLHKMFNYEKGAADNPGVLQVLEQFSNMSNGMVMQGSRSFNHIRAQGEMMQGNALLVPSGIWIESEMQGQSHREHVDLDMMAAPALTEGGPRFIQINYEQMMVPRDSKNPELAKEFLRFLYSDRSVRLFAEKSNGVLAVNDAREMAKSIISPFVYNLYGILEEKDVTAFPVSFDSATGTAEIYDKIFNGCVIPLLEGEIDAQEGARRLEQFFAEMRQK